MTDFKCKMCGAVIEGHGKETIVTCEYCGTQQMLPWVEVPTGFTDEAELIRIKNHRESIDKSNVKIKKLFWLEFVALAVLPSVPAIFNSFGDCSIGEGLWEKIIGALIMGFSFSIVQLSFSLPSLITTVIYIFAKPKTEKKRKRLRVINILSKIFLFSEITWWFFIGLGGIAAVSEDLSFGLMFLLMAICDIGLLILSFMKKDYQY